MRVSKSLLAFTIIISLQFNFCENKELDKDIITNLKFTGTFENTLPSASSPGRKITLTLAMDSTATMTTDYMNGMPVFIEKGNWYHEHEKIILAIDSDTLVFELINEDLVALEYDRNAWGEKGLELKKKVD